MAGAPDADHKSAVRGGVATRYQVVGLQNGLPDLAATVMNVSENAALVSGDHDLT